MPPASLSKVVRSDSAASNSVKGSIPPEVDGKGIIPPEMDEIEKTAVGGYAGAMPKFQICAKLLCQNSSN